METNEKELTGYPHIDKPWEKYFKEELFQRAYPQESVYDYVYEMNKDRHNEIAIQYFNAKITYGDLFNRVDECTKSLVAAGIKKGDIVSVCMLMSPEVAVLLLSINRIGATSNFIAVNSTEKEMQKQLSIVESSIVFVTEMFESKIKKSSQGTPVKRIISIPILNSASWFVRILTNKKKSSCESWKEFIVSGKGEVIPEVYIEADDIAVLEYTSGTTGESKACMLTNRSLNSAGYHDNRCAGLFDLQSGQSILASIPPFLAFGLVMNIIMPLEVGLKLLMIPDPIT